MAQRAAVLMAPSGGLILACGLVSAVLGFWLAPAAPADFQARAMSPSVLPTSPIVVAAIGDSITYGWGAGNPQVDGWPSVLANIGGFCVLNRGVGDDTTALMVARFDDDVLSSSPKKAIILGGLNDLTKGVPPEQIHANIQWMVSRATANGIRPFVGTLTPTRSKYEPIASLNAWIRGYVARTPGVGLVDFYTALEMPVGSGTTTYLADWNHPNTQGYRLMAETALRSLRATSIRLSSRSQTLSVYGGTLRVAGVLLKDGVGLPGQRVVLQSAIPGAPFRDVSGASLTQSSAATSTAGIFEFLVVPRNRTYYRVRFAGSSEYAMCGPTAGIFALPHTLVSTPHVPSTMSHAKYSTVYGYLRPRHAAGTRPVRIYLWKKTASGRWKSYSYVVAKASDYESYSRYARRLRLEHTGRWRFRAYAPTDTGHAASWSSGYDYATVK